MGTAIDDLLAEAFTDPNRVISDVGEKLDFASPSERCQLLRALGNACRELRRTAEAAEHHQAALDLAVMLGDRRLEGLAAMSLSATLTYDGEFKRALELVDRSVGLLEGDDRLIALSQRAGILQRAGRHHDALGAFSDAFSFLESTSEPSIVGDLWMNRGVLYGWLGDVSAGERDTQRAFDLFMELGWTKRAADMQHNLAWLAGRRGDIVAALRSFDLAQEMYSDAGVPSLSIFPDRCETLIAAGLAREALATAERSAAGLEATGDHVDQAEALLLVARAALLAEHNDRAVAAAQQASAIFSHQRRGGWSSAADALALEARLRAGQSKASDVGMALAISAAALDAGLGEVGIDARLLAADIAARLGDWESCELAIAPFDESPLGLVARFRLARVRAQISASRGDRDAALETCQSALDDFADLAGALGGTEMRASIAIHANRLASLGLKLALDASDSDAVLQWAERQRASALAPPPVQPPEDPELERDLTELRTALLALDETGRAGFVDREAEGRVAMAQERVRRRIQSMPGGLGYQAAAIASVTDLAGDAAWAMFLQSEGQQYAIFVDGDDAELVCLGAVDEIERAAASVSGGVALHLRAGARGVQRDPAPILAAAARLDGLLFNGFHSRSDRVVVCPVGAGYNLPWGLLPTLREREFVLTPSIAAYLRCRRMEPLGTGRVVAVAGPRLELAEQEAQAVLGAHGGGTLLTGPGADAHNVRLQISGADIVHIACHGRFELESPMFSSLELHGGPMFVHEFERLRPCPRVTVLSACHAGNHASLAESEILGLSASLVAAGARSVVAATFAVPDSPATVAIMRGIHDSLASGADVADGLRLARVRDPLLGGAFVCHGAGWN